MQCVSSRAWCACAVSPLLHTRPQWLRPVKPRSSYTTWCCSHTSARICRQSSLAVQWRAGRAPARQRLLTAMPPRQRVATRALESLLLPSLWPANGPWGRWAGLIAAGAFGLWAERNTRLGRDLSAALVATLAGMALANTGYLPAHPPEAGAVFRFLMPLAVPLLLLGANLRRVLFDTGRMLRAFLLGAATTAAASVAAAAVFPLGPALGDEGWRIAAALTARHIGGAVNYMAVCDALGVSASTLGAGLAADDLLLSLYFVTLYALAARTMPEPGADADAAADNSGGGGHGGVGGRVVRVYEGGMALALSALLCYVGSSLASAWGVPAQSITVTTGLTMALASAAPAVLAPLAPSGQGLALLLMQVFFAAVGASADVGLVLARGPVLFGFSALALAGHLGLLLLAGKLLGLNKAEVLLGSNACIGGPSTVAGMAAAKGWPSLLVPAVLASTLGYALGTAVGLALGPTLLRPLCARGA